VNISGTVRDRYVEPSFCSEEQRLQAESESEAIGATGKEIVVGSRMGRSGISEFTGN